MNKEIKDPPAICGQSKNEKISDKIKSFFTKLCRNNITVSRNKDIFTMPVIAFLVIAIATWKLSVPVIIISLFCLVEYTISGEDFPEKKKISFRPEN